MGTYYFKSGLKVEKLLFCEERTRVSPSIRRADNFYNNFSGRHTFRIDGEHAFLYMLTRYHTPSQRQSDDSETWKYDYSTLSYIFNGAVDWYASLQDPTGDSELSSVDITGSIALELKASLALTLSFMIGTTGLLVGALTNISCEIVVQMRHYGTLNVSLSDAVSIGCILIKGMISIPIVVVPGTEGI
eukprot:gene23374-29587_t